MGLFDGMVAGAGASVSDVPNSDDVEVEGKLSILEMLGEGVECGAAQIAGPLVHGAKSLYNSGAAVIDMATGDSVGAADHGAEAAVQAIEAIPGFGSGVGLAGAYLGEDKLHDRMKTTLFGEDIPTSHFEDAEGDPIEVPFHDMTDSEKIDADRAAQDAQYRREWEEDGQRNSADFERKMDDYRVKLEAWNDNPVGPAPVAPIDANTGRRFGE